MAKRAFVVVGPESSGTKFITKLFITAGCWGDAWHQQRLDSQNPPKGVDLVVFRRSFPHDGEWPNIKQIRDRFNVLGFSVYIVVVIRSLHFTLKSRRQNASGNLHLQATEAFRKIGGSLPVSKKSVWLTYEALVNYPESTINGLFDWAKLPAPKDVEIKDGNEKYV